jgi:hypothetical protein
MFDPTNGKRILIGTDRRVFSYTQKGSPDAFRGRDGK